MFDISPADGAHPSGESKILPAGVAEKVLQANRLVVDLPGRRVYVEWDKRRSLNTRFWSQYLAQKFNLNYDPSTRKFQLRGSTNTNSATQTPSSPRCLHRTEIPPSTIQRSLLNKPDAISEPPVPDRS